MINVKQEFEFGATESVVSVQDSLYSSKNIVYDVEYHLSRGHETQLLLCEAAELISAKLDEIYESDYERAFDVLERLFQAYAMDPLYFDLAQFLTLAERITDKLPTILKKEGAIIRSLNMLRMISALDGIYDTKFGSFMPKIVNFGADLALTSVTSPSVSWSDIVCEWVRSGVKAQKTAAEGLLWDVANDYLYVINSTNSLVPESMIYALSLIAKYQTQILKIYAFYNKLIDLVKSDSPPLYSSALIRAALAIQKSKSENAIDHDMIVQKIVQTRHSADSVADFADYVAEIAHYLTEHSLLIAASFLGTHIRAGKIKYRENCAAEVTKALIKIISIDSTIVQHLKDDTDILVELFRGGKFDLVAKIIKTDASMAACFFNATYPSTFNYLIKLKALSQAPCGIFVTATMLWESRKQSKEFSYKVADQLLTQSEWYRLVQLLEPENCDILSPITFILLFMVEYCDPDSIKTIIATKLPQKLMKVLKTGAIDHEETCVMAAQLLFSLRIDKNSEEDENREELYHEMANTISELFAQNQKIVFPVALNILKKTSKNKDMKFKYQHNDLIIRYLYAFLLEDDKKTAKKAKKILKRLKFSVKCPKQVFGEESDEEAIN